MKLRFIPMVTLGGALLLAGCMDSPSPTDLSPALDIVDAEHGDDDDEDDGDGDDDDDDDDIEEGAIDEGITIDATALTAPTFFLSGFGGFPSATPVELQLTRWHVLNSGEFGRSA